METRRLSLVSSLVDAVFLHAQFDRSRLFVLEPTSTCLPSPEGRQSISLEYTQLENSRPKDPEFKPRPRQERKKNWWVKNVVLTRCQVIMTEWTPTGVILIGKCQSCSSNKSCLANLHIHFEYATFQRSKYEFLCRVSNDMTKNCHDKGIPCQMYSIAFPVSHSARLHPPPPHPPAPRARMHAHTSPPPLSLSPQWLICICWYV